MRQTHLGYHNVGIFMGVNVEKDKVEFSNPDPEKCAGWQWMKWEKFVNLEKELALLDSIGSVLDWDQQCVMPKAGTSHRGFD